MTNQRSLLKPPLPPPLPGFEHVNRFWDPVHQQFAAKITPGQYYVTDRHELVGTVLGSCVSACVRDPALGLGGMNHFMLPSRGAQHFDHMETADEAARYGTHAMELLINALLKQGARRDRLEFKLVGGGAVLRNMTDVGQRNIEFVLKFLENEGFDMRASDLGDVLPRKVLYFPQTGRMLVKKLRDLHNDTVLKREITYRSQLDVSEPRDSGSVELFS